MRAADRVGPGYTNERGGSIIEVLVALGLFAVIASSMSTFLIHNIRSSGTNHLHTRALTLAENALETARASRVGDLTSSTKTQTVGGIRYTVATVVQHDVPATGLKRITANVSWTDHRGPQLVSVPTIYTEVRRY